MFLMDQYLMDQYGEAQRAERVARIRRAIALRAMAATGRTQRQIAEALGVSQSAVSQQLSTTPVTSDLDPALLVESGAPIIKVLAAERGFSRLAVFGSVARGDARTDSDIDLLVESPAGMSSFDFVRFQQLLAEVLGRHVDVVDYAGLTAGLDDDIIREAVPL